MSVRDLQGWRWGLYLTSSPKLSFWVKAVTSSLSCSLPQSLPWVHSPGRQLKTHLAVGEQRGGWPLNMGRGCMGLGCDRPLHHWAAVLL